MGRGGRGEETSQQRASSSGPGESLAVTEAVYMIYTHVGGGWEGERWRRGREGGDRWGKGTAAVEEGLMMRGREWS